MGTTTCDKADEVRNTEMCFLFFGCLQSPWNMPFPRETLPLPLPPYLHFSFGMELTQQSYVCIYPNLNGMFYEQKATRK